MKLLKSQLYFEKLQLSLQNSERLCLFYITFLPFMKYDFLLKVIIFLSHFQFSVVLLTYVVQQLHILMKFSDAFCKNVSIKKQSFLKGHIQFCISNNSSLRKSRFALLYILALRILALSLLNNFETSIMPSIVKKTQIPQVIGSPIIS